MEKEKKRLLIKCIIGEIILAIIVVIAIIIFVKVPSSSWQVKTLSICAVLFGLFQMFILIPSVFKDILKK